MILRPQPGIAWHPQEGPQTALIRCPVFEVFFGGARGGGKTEGSLGDWLEHSNAYGEAATGVFFRRKFKQLSEVIARSQQIYKKLGAEFNTQRSEWKMKGGGRLLFRYLERDSDAEEYQGHNYTRVYFEEVTNFPTPNPINLMRATLRSPSGVPVGMRLTGNPGGPGHNWVKARFITPNPSGYQVITDSEIIVLDGKSFPVELSRVFIPSKVTDNRLLMQNDPTYLLRLKQSGSDALVKAWLEGNWDVIDGAFFSEFDAYKHVLDTNWLKAIPKHCLRFRAFDWGSAKPFSVGWYALSDGTWGLPKGALLKYREWYGASGPNKGLKMLAKSVAEGIRFREEPGEVIQYSVADPAIFIADGGPSIAEEMSKAGVTWRRADNKRVPGAELVHQRLRGQLTAPDPEIPWSEYTCGAPLLYFLETCVDTIRTLPTLQHDENDAEDVDTDGEDHAYDELRYAVMSRPWDLPQPSPSAYSLPRLPSQLTFNELVERLRNKRLQAQEN